MIQSISSTVDVVGTCQSTVGAPVNCHRPTVIEVILVMLYADIKVVTPYSTIFFYTGAVYLPVSVFARNSFLEAQI